MRPSQPCATAHVLWTNNSIGQTFAAFAPMVIKTIPQSHGLEALLEDRFPVKLKIFAL